ncbi:MAG: hypothetical protein M1820_004064 [Bogoriella megaspora]|nr:MAG: hypothetical protein M1820_004064 [Bogoriella megaspora]
MSLSQARDGSSSLEVFEQTRTAWSCPIQRPLRRYASKTSQTKTVDVFAIPELLEMMLLLVPMKDVLLSQRVCRHWKAVIDSSIQLQQHLFFVPCGDPVCLLRRSSRISKSKASFCGWVSSTSGDVSAKGVGTVSKEHEDDRQITVRINPACLNRFYPEQDGRPSYYCFKTCFFKGPEAGSNASWRRMLLTQPPVAKLTTYIHLAVRQNLQPYQLGGRIPDYHLGLCGFELTGLKIEELYKGIAVEAKKRFRDLVYPDRSPSTQPAQGNETDALSMLINQMVNEIVVPERLSKAQLAGNGRGLVDIGIKCDEREDGRE